MKEYQNLKQALASLKEAYAWICLTDEDVRDELSLIISQIKDKMEIIEDQEE